jgi:SRSO17 transposase
MSRKSKRQFQRGKHKPPASGRGPSLRLSQRDVEASADELVAFHRLFQPLFQRREQRQWSAFYLCGQLANLERKTIEAMVLALKGPDLNAIRGLQQFIGQGRWMAKAMLVQHQALVAEWFGEPDGVVIVDGSGFPKRGPYSAGVAPQYCGHLGKVANCQEGVFLVYASSRGYTFLDERLYVPECWFGEDYRERWQRCGLPDDLRFQTEPTLGLEMIGDLVSQGVVPFRWVTADEHYGETPVFLDEISALGKWYLVEVPAQTRVWLRTPAVEPPGRGLLGRPRTRPRVARNAPRPRQVGELADGLPTSKWTRRIIKEGSKGPLVAEFAFLRATTIRDGLPGPRVWVVFRRTLGAQPELKSYFSNAPTTCPRSEFIRVSGLRWPVETALEEGKGEVGMDHYETRSWQGWHHHMAQTFQAHLFLMRLRLIFQKKPGADHSAGASLGCSSHRERQRPPARYSGDSRLPSTAKLRRLSFASQAHTQAPSPAAPRVAKAQSLVVA